MPREYKRKPGSRERVPINKEVMKKAVYEVIENNKSLRGIAKTYDLNVMTLKRYVRKKRKSLVTGSASPTYEPNYKQGSVFTDEEESDLVSYLETSSKLFHGLTTKETRKLAYQFSVANNKNVHSKWHESESASYEWLHSFMRRHKNLSLRVPEATSLSRATSFNRHNVSKFFENLKNVYTKHKFEAHEVWNIDETGISTVHKPKKIIATKGLKQVSKVTSAERGELVNVCSAISASGIHVPPFFIFPRKNWQARMIDNAPPGSDGATNPSGWMTSPNFVLYLQHFKKHVRCSKENKCLIIFDNHESHISIDSINFARDNGIILLTIPPHTSQKLQPLDRILFGTLKSYYNTACDDWMLAHPGRPITIYDIASCLGKAYPSAMTPRNIIKSFEITGIYPFNSDIFTDDEFLSSYVTDRPEEQSISGAIEIETTAQEVVIPDEIQQTVDESSPVIAQNINIPTNSSSDVLPNNDVLTNHCPSLIQLSLTTVESMVHSSDCFTIEPIQPTPHSQQSSSNMKISLASSIHSIKDSIPSSGIEIHTTDSTQFPTNIYWSKPSTSGSSNELLEATKKNANVSQETFLDTSSISIFDTVSKLASKDCVEDLTSSKSQAVMIPQSTLPHYVKLDVIKPFPKAGARKTSGRGRKKGSSRIVTDTPEKLLIEKESLEREEKKKKKAAAAVKRNLKGIANQKSKGQKTKVQKGSSSKRQKRNSISSEDENFTLPSSPESIYTVEDEKQISSEEEEEHYYLHDDVEDNVREGDWIVVNFVSERSIPHRYVGQVVNESLASLDVQFAKKINDKKFKWPEKPDVSVIGKYQVVQKLPPPEFKSSSKRVGAFEFPKSLRQFKIDRS